MRSVIRGSLLVTALCAAVSGCGGSNRTPSSPVRIATAWLQAVTDHNAAKARSYFAPADRFEMNWEGPPSQWGGFTHVRCRSIRPLGAQASVECKFDELPSRYEGTPVSSWAVDFRRSNQGWLITNYGQG